MNYPKLSAGRYEEYKYGKKIKKNKESLFSLMEK
jgi:hypothetical protein